MQYVDLFHFEKRDQVQIGLHANILLYFLNAMNCDDVVDTTIFLSEHDLDDSSKYNLAYKVRWREKWSVIMMIFVLH